MDSRSCNPDDSSGATGNLAVNAVAAISRSDAICVAS